MERYHVAPLAILLYVVSYHQAAAAQPKPITAEARRQQLAQIDQIIWQQTALRTGLHNIGAQWDIPIFLDRRVDPNQLIDFQATKQSRGELLDRLAASIGLKVCLVDSIVYMGPQETAEVVASVAEARFDQANSLTKDAGRLLRKRTALEWEEATAPRELVEKLAGQSRVTVEDLQNVPHDLWPAASWPPIPVTHQLVLLLAGFDLTYEFSEKASSLQIVPLPPSFELVRTYQIAGNAQQRTSELQKSFPAATFQLNGNKLSVAGSAEDHFLIRRQLAGLRPLAPRRQSSGEQRYTLTVRGKRFEEVAAAIAKTLVLQLQYDAQIADVKDQRIELMTREASRDELLEALVKSVNLRYSIDGQTLLIHP